MPLAATDYFMDSQDFQPPTPIAKRGAGIKGRSEFTSFGFFPIGWEVQPPQPPAATTISRRSGIHFKSEFLCFPFLPAGWEVQPPQPPPFPPKHAAAAVMIGDDGAQAPLIVQPPIWWDTLAVQPGIRPPPALRASAAMRGDDGNYLQLFAALLRFNLESTPTILRRRPVFVDLGDASIGAGVVPVPLPIWWEEGGGDAGHFRFVFPLPQNDESQIAFVPPIVNAATWALDISTLARTRRVDSRFSAALDLLGSTVVPIPPAITWGYERPELVVRRQLRAALQADEHLVSIIRRQIWGFESAFVDIRRAPHSTFIENNQVVREVFVPPPPPIWGYDAAAPFVRIFRPRAIADRGFELISSFPPVWTSGWEFQLPQPPHPRREKIAGILRGDDGTEAVVIIPIFDGWEIAYGHLPRSRVRDGRPAATSIGDFNSTIGPFSFPVPSGAVAKDFAVWEAAVFDVSPPIRW